MAAEQEKPKTIFYSLSQALKNNKKDIPAELLKNSDLLTNNPNSEVNSIQQQQQRFADFQTLKVAQDLYSRSMYYDSDRISAYNDYRAMDQSPEISVALDIMSDECLAFDTVIPLLNGEKITIENLYKQNRKEFWVYSYNIEKQQIEPGLCEGVVYKGEQDVYEVVFDDNSSIKATGEHMWLLKNEGKYIETKNLKLKDSIQPFYSSILNESKSNSQNSIKSINFIGKVKTYDLINVNDNNNYAILTTNGTGVFVHNCVTRNDRGEILTIYSEDSRIKRVLTDLFHGTLNINYNLWFWIRNLLKYGDNFLKLELDQNLGVYNITQLPTGEIHKEIGYDGNPSSVRFKWDINNMYFEDFQIAHFSLISDGDKMPYGKSVLDPVRKLWKQLQLAEDALLVYRLVRAPERRMFFIDVGNTDTPDVRQYIEKMKAELKKSQVVDTQGRINMKFNMLPVWSQTPIPLLDGRTITIEQLAKEFNDGKENFVYSVQDSTHSIVPGKVIWCGKNYTAEKLIKVWLDDNTWILTAPEHPFVLRDGTSKMAIDLKSGDSLMPYYIEQKEVWSKKSNKLFYETIYNPNKQKFEFTHRLVAKEINNDNAKFKNTIHHKDFNRFNNYPNNLEWVNFVEHRKMHGDLARKNWSNPEFKKKVSETIKSKYASGDLDETKEQNRKKIIAYNKSEKKIKRVIEKNKERDSIQSMRWYNGSDLHVLHNNIRSNSKKDFWKNNYNKISASKNMSIQTNKKCFDIICELIKHQTEFISIDNFVKTLIDTVFFNELKSINSNKGRDLTKYFHRHNLTKLLRENNIANYTEFLKIYNPLLLSLKKENYSKNRKEWNKKNIIQNSKTGRFEYKNHKVLKIEEVFQKEDVYCMTVVGLNDQHDRHNFACLSFNLDGSFSKSGVYVKNTFEEDFFIPVRGDKTGTRVETLPGACLALNTKIPLLDGRTLTLQEIINEWDEGKDNLWVYSCNPQTGESSVAPITWAGITKRNTQVMKITLDNGKEIVCTPDHKFLTRDGKKVKAKNLSENQSLMPFYTKKEPISKNKKDYIKVWDNHQSKWIFVHRLVSSIVKLDEFQYEINESKTTIHHRDFNRFNNDPKNLVLMGNKDHWIYHSSLNKSEFMRNLNKERFKNEEFKQKIINRLKSSIKNRDNEYLRKKDRISKNKLKVLSENITKKNKSDEWKKYAIKGGQKVGKKNIHIYNIWVSLTNKNEINQTYNEFKENYKLNFEHFKSYSIYDFTLDDLKNIILNNNNIKLKDIGFDRHKIYRILKQNGFQNFSEYKKNILNNYNHKIIKIEYLQDKIDTGTITVDGNEMYHNYHTFALESGIYNFNSNLGDIADVEYLQNKLFTGIKVPKTYLNYGEALPGGSTLSQADLRFARTINRFQEAIILELRNIANIHLKMLGFDDDINNFTLTLTNPSTQQELLKLETMKARLDVFKEMFSSDATAPVSYTWAMEFILGFSKSEIKQILRQKKIERKMFYEIERAHEEYMDTGIFTELDKKFRKPDFDPNTQIDTGQEGEGGGDSGGGGFGGFGSGSSFGLGDTDTAGLDNLGGDIEDLGGGDTNSDDSGATEPEPETDDTLKENILLNKNRVFDNKTKNLLEGVNSFLKKINKINENKE